MKNKSDLKIRVDWEATVHGKKHTNIEDENSWFLFDQRGGIYSMEPLHGLEPKNERYDNITPLIKINDDYLSIKEIEDFFNKHKQ